MYDMSRVEDRENSILLMKNSLFLEIVVEKIGFICIVSVNITI